MSIFFISSHPDGDEKEKKFQDQSHMIWQVLTKNKKPQPFIDSGKEHTLIEQMCVYLVVHEIPHISHCTTGSVFFTVLRAWQAVTIDVFTILFEILIETHEELVYKFINNSYNLKIINFYWLWSN